MREATEDLIRNMSISSVRTDYHSHILPAMDDGPEDRETAAEMLHLLRRQGIATVYATPHYYRHLETVENFLERRGRAAGMLAKEAEALGLKLLLGAEIHIEQGISGLEKVDALVYENTRSVLLEFPWKGFENWMLEEAEAVCCRHKLIPVFAHLERYLDLFSRGEIQRILDVPASVVQINTGSLKKRRVRRWARSLLNEGYPILFGSDCHNLWDRKPKKPPFYAKRLLREAETL